MDEPPSRALEDAAHADARLIADGCAAPEPAADEEGGRPQPPTAWVAQQLIGAAREAGKGGLMYVASSARRAEEIARALRQFAPDVEVLGFPPWDCLPYDRASPSRECMGRRMAVLARLAQPLETPRVLVTGPEALLQRVPPAAVLGIGFLRLAAGDRLDREGLERFAAVAGYIYDDRVDEPGEIALLGEVVDVFPAAAETPARIALDDEDRMLEIKSYDPLSQRTEEPVDEVWLGPASELLLEDPAAVERTPGVEHRGPEVYGGAMRTLLDAARPAMVAEDPHAAERLAEIADQILEAYDSQKMLGEAEPPLAPDRLYLGDQELGSALARRKRLKLEAGAVAAIPNFALTANPGRAFSDFVRDRLDAGRKVVLAGLAHELRPLVRALRRGLDLEVEPMADWPAAMTAGAASVVGVTADLEGGFDDLGAGLVVIAAADVLGGRIAPRGGEAAATLVGDPDLRVGDVVIHEDHGLGVLTALERVTVDGSERDALRLEYHGGASLLVPIEDFDRVWRYGADAEAVTLDRLHTDAWASRRAELSAEIERTAARLVEMARERSATAGAALRPPRAAYARIAARFPYPETRDQAAAIEAVLEDMASGRVMRRLVCGDVGFGKTEVAVRAAAAAALCGRQVAIVAPTTVLARQHLETFRRRFAGTGVEVGHLSRLVPAGEAKAVKAGLADGSIGIVVGTHALASNDVEFADLALLVIDEEQRFGARLKAQLKELSPEAHLLTMTATPIPRTLQMALVGVEDVSVIATPPARRRPVRTFLAPYDPATVRTALLRERRRGGQSFVVSPRIEDIAGLAEELDRITPELTVRIAHGELPPREVDEVMVAFAGGQGDVLLATNIIESGLDVPRANTMLIWRADLFGLAQLHQLRGRVGRSRAQGVAYLFHDPDQPLADTTRARLSTLEAFDRLGSGLAISARDLEIRGAGDLVGDEQAGHLKLIGTALYQKLLAQAVRAARGEMVGGDWTPELNIGLTGALPETYVPDATTRINLYARLARLNDPEDVERFAEELDDRFGPPPAEAANLLDLARIRSQARAVGIRRIDAGCKAVALTLARPLSSGDLAKLPHLKPKDGRLVWRKAAKDDAPRTAEIQALLDRLAKLVG